MPLSLSASSSDSSTKSLETALNQKTQPVFASSFAVGSGSSANSMPSLGGDNAAGGIPTWALVGGGIAALFAFLLILRKK